MGVSGFPELIGEREQQDDERRLIGGIDRQDVEADALGLTWLVEEAIALGFGESGIDGVARERFEFAHGGSGLSSYSPSSSFSSRRHYIRIRSGRKASRRVQECSNAP